MINIRYNVIYILILGLIDKMIRLSVLESMSNVRIYIFFVWYVYYLKLLCCNLENVKLLVLVVNLV